MTPEQPEPVPKARSSGRPLGLVGIVRNSGGGLPHFTGCLPFRVSVYRLSPEYLAEDIVLLSKMLRRTMKMADSRLLGISQQLWIDRPS